MSEDIQKEPVRPPRADLPAGRPNPARLDSNGPAYPVTVRAAGLLWIVFGCLSLLGLGFLLLLCLGHQGTDPKDKEVSLHAFLALLTLIPLGLVGTEYLWISALVVQGAPADVGRIAFVSIIFGAASFFAAIESFRPGVLNGWYDWDAHVAVLNGIALLAAGVLALAGRRQYGLWREAQKDRGDREATDRKARRRLIQ